jgi:hypothetical protein
VAFAGHSMAATSIFTVPITLNILILDGGIVTRVPEDQKWKRIK